MWKEVNLEFVVFSEVIEVVGEGTGVAVGSGVFVGDKVAAKVRCGERVAFNFDTAFSVGAVATAYRRNADTAVIDKITVSNFKKTILSIILPRDS